MRPLTWAVAPQDRALQAALLGQLVAALGSLWCGNHGVPAKAPAEAKTRRTEPSYLKTKQPSILHRGRPPPAKVTKHQREGGGAHLKRRFTF